MKLNATRRGNEQGSILVYALVSCLVIAITLAAYMDLASAQHRAVVRTESWNHAVPIAEAGIEEGMTQLHLYQTNLSANGWLVTSNGLTLSNNISLSGVQYYQQRTVGSGRYIVAVSGDTSPVITSQAYTKSPINNEDIVRTIQITTAGGALFARGLVAKGDITWTGNILSDSFDSSDPTYSTGGRYDVAKRKDNGSVGSVTGTFSMGGGIIYGSAGIGPLGAFTDGGGVVGDASWVNAGNTGVQPGHFENDLNLSFPDVIPPFTTGTTPSGGNVTNYTYLTNSVPIASIPYPFSYTGSIVTNFPTSTTYPSGTTHPVTTNVTTSTTGKGKKKTTTYSTNYTYYEFTYYTNTVTTNTTTQYYDMILDTGDYYTFSIPNGTQMLVRGNARLYVEDSIAMAGQSQITISTIGTLNLYCNGNAKLAGNGVVNATTDATRFSFWGTPNCTDVELGGNAEFTGTIYAPQAYFHAGGGGSNQYDIVGAAIVDEAKLNGHFLFHFDEKLINSGARSSFVVTGWNEI
jgi:hypothetical protein